MGAPIASAILIVMQNIALRERSQTLKKNTYGMIPFIKNASNSQTHRLVVVEGSGGGGRGVV